MPPDDFLHKRAETELCEYYAAAGNVFSFSTNCQRLMESARGSFSQAKLRSGSASFSLRFWVDDTDREQGPWPQPYVRGLGQLVFAGFTEGSSMLVDLRTRRVIGRLSHALAADHTHWKNIVVPILFSILAGSIGLVEVHASCVARNNEGLVLIGPSRSGKSTLALALTQAGFRLLSDDRTFCGLGNGQLLAYGLPRPLKLRRDAAVWFKEFVRGEATHVQSGEPVFYYEPQAETQSQGPPACEPQALIFLDRREDSQFCLSRMEPSEMRAQIERDLLAEDPEAARQQERVLYGLTEIPSWRLRYGGTPRVIAEQIVEHFSTF